MAEKETEKKAPAKKAAPKAAAAKEAKPAAKKEAAPKAAAKPAAKKEAAPKKAKTAYSGPTLVVVQVGSPIGRQEYQRATLIGLGLNKMHRKSTLPDTPAVRGMIEKVKHLVRVEGAK